MHSDVVAQGQSESWEMEVIPNISDATAAFTSHVEHDDVQEMSVELVSSASGREVSLDQIDQHVVAHNDMQSISPAGPLIVRSILVESVMGTNVAGRSKEVSTVPVTQVVAPDSIVSASQEDIHSNPRIQQDMELWRRICEYDAKSPEMPFTTVLTKKQKQHLKKIHIGKPSYRTRSRGEPSLYDQ